MTSLATPGRHWLPYRAVITMVQHRVLSTARYLSLAAARPLLTRYRYTMWPATRGRPVRQHQTTSCWLDISRWVSTRTWYAASRRLARTGQLQRGPRCFRETMVRLLTRTSQLPCVWIWRRHLGHGPQVLR